MSQVQRANYEGHEYIVAENTRKVKKKYNRFRYQDTRGQQKALQVQTLKIFKLKTSSEQNGNRAVLQIVSMSSFLQKPNTIQSVIGQQSE